MFTGHKMGPPLCGTGNGRDGDKLLCNIRSWKERSKELGRFGKRGLVKNVPSIGLWSHERRITCKKIAKAFIGKFIYTKGYFKIDDGTKQ